VRYVLIFALLFFGCGAEPDAEPNCSLVGTHLNDDDRWCLDFEYTEECSEASVIYGREATQSARDNANRAMSCGSDIYAIMMIDRFYPDSCQWDAVWTPVSPVEHESYCAKLKS
jgi:hypothetical protein